MMHLELAALHEIRHQHRDITSSIPVLLVPSPGIIVESLGNVLGFLLCFRSRYRLAILAE